MKPCKNVLLFLAAATSLACGGELRAQVEARLQGTWVGASEENRGERVTIDQNSMLVDGERIPIRSGGPGVLILGDPDDDWRLSYSFKGAELLVTEDGFTSSWSKSGNPKPVIEEPEIEKPVIEEPITGNNSTQFVGTYRLNDVTLVLRSRDGHSYDGELSVGSQRFPVSATFHQGTLEGSFDQNGRPSQFTAWTEEASTLSVRNGGKTLKLRQVDQPRNQTPERRGEPSASEGTISFERRSVTDPMLGGIQSHTFYVPSGYEVQGGVLWTPTQSVTNQLFMSVSDRSGAAYTSDKCRHFFYADPQSLQMTGKRMGQDLGDGTVVLGPPQKIGDAAQWAILPGLRPNARDIQIVDARIDQPMERFYQEHLAPREAPSTPENRMWHSCEIVLVTYTENGQAYEEELSYIASGFHNSYSGMGVGVDSEAGTWATLNTNSIRAPRGQLRARRDQLCVIRSSVRPTPQWWTSQSKIVADIMAARQRRHQITMDGLRETGRQIAKTYSDISDIQMQTYRNSVDSQDRIQRATIDATWEVERYSSTNGGTIEVSNQYDRVFENANGGLIMTNDPSYQVGLDTSVNNVNWTELSRAPR